MHCKAGEILVPEHCRSRSAKKKDSRRLTRDEKDAIKERIARIEKRALPDGKPTPLLGTRGPVDRALQFEFDVVNVSLTNALHVVPLFFTGALMKMLHPENRKSIPDPHKRYVAIKKKFCKSWAVKTLPAVYEYILLKLCLIAG